jgi:CRISPR/Cas system CSM-associated protein Csm3 (group 7 of RAMP superfamily)
MDNNLRYIARIFIEATSGFCINSGDKSLLLDNAIARDANGLPYIPGTSIAGIVQHACLRSGLSQQIGHLFGCTQHDAQKKGLPNHSDSGNGSRFIFSSAHLVGADGQAVIDGLIPFDSGSEYVQKMLLLPQRDHVKITDRGTAKERGKFDRELGFKGTRFCFEIQLVGEEKDRDDFEKVLQILQDETVRIGAGTRKGAGSFKVLSENSQYWILDLTSKEDLLAYLQKSSNLNAAVNKKSVSFPESNVLENGWKKYQLELSAEDFFLFGAGFSDKDADNTPKTEYVINWNKNQSIPKFSEMYLLPATSIKGAISHRTAYHYNQLKGIHIGSQQSFKAEDFGWQVQEVIDKGLSMPETANWSHDDPRWEKAMKELEEQSPDEFLVGSKKWQHFTDATSKYGERQSDNPTAENNTAVSTLFGVALNDKTQDITTRIGQIGRVIIDDIYLEKPKEKEKDVAKVFNHVKIDRFTGGAFSGALFQEKALYSDQTIVINLLINTNDLEESSEYLTALENALNDLQNGHLALGGATTKGYGVFKNATV